jgi:hypothetical protein
MSKDKWFKNGIENLFYPQNSFRVIEIILKFLLKHIQFPIFILQFSIYNRHSSIKLIPQLPLYHPVFSIQIFFYNYINKSGFFQQFNYFFSFRFIDFKIQFPTGF